MVHIKRLNEMAMNRQQAIDNFSKYYDDFTESEKYNNEEWLKDALNRCITDANGDEAKLSNLVRVLSDKFKQSVHNGTNGLTDIYQDFIDTVKKYALDILTGQDLKNFKTNVANIRFA